FLREASPLNARPTRSSLSFGNRKWVCAIFVCVRLARHHSQSDENYKDINNGDKVNENCPSCYAQIVPTLHLDGQRYPSDQRVPHDENEGNASQIKRIRYRS